MFVFLFNAFYLTKQNLFSFLINKLQVFGARIYGNEFMKKNNNKHRNNNNYNNQIYSLNYRFDSISCAGKISGTALDLIKKYNELAKEAQGNADYVEAENFRQYAEHYRKIVTEINERKNQQRAMEVKDAEPQQTQNEEVDPVQEENVSDNNQEANAKVSPKREFKVIEIKDSSQSDTSVTVKATSPRGRRSTKSAEDIAAI